jgi:hypothetical protein
MVIRAVDQSKGGDVTDLVEPYSTRSIEQAVSFFC